MDEYTRKVHEELNAKHLEEAQRQFDQVVRLLAEDPKGKIELNDREHAIVCAIVTTTSRTTVAAAECLQGVGEIARALKQLNVSV